MEEVTFVKCLLYWILTYIGLFFAFTSSSSKILALLAGMVWAYGQFVLILKIAQDTLH